MRLLRTSTRGWMVIIAVLAILAGTVSGIWRIVCLRKQYQLLARELALRPCQSHSSVTHRPVVENRYHGGRCREYLVA